MNNLVFLQKIYTKRDVQRERLIMERTYTKKNVNSKELPQGGCIMGGMYTGREGHTQRKTYTKRDIYRERRI